MPCIAWTCWQPPFPSTLRYSLHGDEIIPEVLITKLYGDWSWVQYALNCLDVLFVTSSLVSGKRSDVMQWGAYWITAYLYIWMKWMRIGLLTSSLGQQDPWVKDPLLAQNSEIRVNLTSSAPFLSQNRVLSPFPGEFPKVSIRRPSSIKGPILQARPDRYPSHPSSKNTTCRTITLIACPPLFAQLAAGIARMSSLRRMNFHFLQMLLLACME